MVKKHNWPNPSNLDRPLPYPVKNRQFQFDSVKGYNIIWGFEQG